MLLPEGMLRHWFIPFVSLALAISVAAVFINFGAGKKPRKVAKYDGGQKQTQEISQKLKTDEGTSAEQGNLDCIVVGAGVAGAALAYTLGKDGRRVLVLERDLSEPDRIAGELLHAGGFLKVQELGLEDCLEGIDSQRLLGYALFKDDKHIKAGYPLEGQASDVAGRTFHNGRFIQKMRMKASSIPLVTLRQGTVLSLLETERVVKGVRYRSTDGKEHEAFAPITFVCDGCFSNLRRTLCSSKIDVESSFVGLVLENCELPYPNHGHVILADPNLIVFFAISSTEVRCLVDVPGKKVPSIANGDLAKYLRTVVAPQLPKSLQGPFLVATEKSKTRTMPNKSMPAMPSPRTGVLLIGDAFNMRHPLTGGGMTVALSDIVVLRNMLQPLKNFHDSAALCDYLQAFYTRRKPIASTINTSAGVLYKVFCATPDPAMKEMQQACFDYLSLGGICSSGLIALVSGLNPRPLSLVVHICAFALYIVGRQFFPFPSFKRLLIGIGMLKGASNIIFPIIKQEGVRQMFFPNTVPAYYNIPPVNAKTI